MSTTESIASSQTSLSSRRKSDTTGPWPVWHRYRRRGAVFPIRAGFGGLIPIR